jgi:hypothetical protein
MKTHIQTVQKGSVGTRNLAFVPTLVILGRTPSIVESSLSGVVQLVDLDRFVM